MGRGQRSEQDLVTGIDRELLTKGISKDVITSLPWGPKPRNPSSQKNSNYQAEQERTAWDSPPRLPRQRWRTRGCGIMRPGVKRRFSSPSWETLGKS